jgi:hypothetical protein
VAEGKEPLILDVMTFCLSGKTKSSIGRPQEFIDVDIWIGTIRRPSETSVIDKV